MPGTNAAEQELTLPQAPSPTMTSFLFNCRSSISNNHEIKNNAKGRKSGLRMALEWDTPVGPQLAFLDIGYGNTRLDYGLFWEIDRSPFMYGFAGDGEVQLVDCYDAPNSGPEQFR